MGSIEIKLQTLRERYLHLRAIDQVPVRDNIIKRCGVSKPVFYNWLGGITEVPKLAQDVIEEVMGERENSYKVIEDESK